MSRIRKHRRLHEILILALALLAALVGVQPAVVLAQDQSGPIYLPLITQGSTPGKPAVDLDTDAELDPAADQAGMVFVLTNQATGNAVAMFRRSADGLLEAAGAAPTGGLGTGSGIGSQGAVVLSDNGRWLLAVNPGSNDVSVFGMTHHGLVLTDRVSSGGVRPISIALYKNLVYVLNAGAAGNITGFHLDAHGRLSPLADSTRPLSNNGSGSAPGPAQVSFNPAGDMLVVTEKATNLLLAYTVDREGLAAGPTAYPSAGMTPFGFAFARQGTLVVAEAFGGAPGASAVSSYSVSRAGIQPISASVPTGQTAACWIAVSKNGKFAYSTNAGSGSVSAYAVQQDGSLSLIDGRAGVTGDGSGPIDVMVSRNGRYLYVLNGSVPSIAIFAVQEDGRLLALGSTTGLPAGAVGLAAW